MIEFQGVSKVFAGHPAVKDLTLELREGAFSVLVGTSGSGKSTTLKMINRLLEPDRGTIRFAGEDIRLQPVLTLRRRMGYAIQSIGLFPHWTVAQNIATVPQLQRWPRARIADRIDELMALLAMAVPVLGFGWLPALIALALYGILPVLQGTLAGLGSIPPGVSGVAEGMGMTGWQRLYKVELPLAAPVILAGIRTSVIVNIGTATIASTVGASTLGTPIIIGLSGFNTAYIVQGALLVALAAIIVDRAFERLTRWISRHRHAQ